MGYLLAFLMLILSFLLLILSHIAYHTYHGNLPKLFKSIITVSVLIALALIAIEFLHNNGFVDLTWIYNMIFNFLSNYK